jgi:hypothetical protein
LSGGDRSIDTTIISDENQISGHSGAQFFKGKLSAYDPKEFSSTIY